MSLIVELHDEPLTAEDPVSKGDGRHLIREGPDDSGIYVHVKDGTITGYSARRKVPGIRVFHVAEVIDGEIITRTYVVYTTPENKEVGWLI
jgi:hypothetical protein